MPATCLAVAAAEVFYALGIAHETTGYVFLRPLVAHAACHWKTEMQGRGWFPTFMRAETLTTVNTCMHMSMEPSVQEFDVNPIVSEVEGPQSAVVVGVQVRPLRLGHAGAEERQSGLR